MSILIPDHNLLNILKKIKFKNLKKKLSTLDKEKTEIREERLYDLSEI